jgi:hypothetical protein
MGTSSRHHALLGIRNTVRVVIVAVGEQHNLGNDGLGGRHPGS